MKVKVQRNRILLTLLTTPGVRATLLGPSGTPSGSCAERPPSVGEDTGHPRHVPTAVVDAQSCPAPRPRSCRGRLGAKTVEDTNVPLHHGVLGPPRAAVGGQVALVVEARRPHSRSHPFALPSPPSRVGHSTVWTIVWDPTLQSDETPYPK